MGRNSSRIHTQIHEKRIHRGSPEKLEWNEWNTTTNIIAPPILTQRGAFSRIFSALFRDVPREQKATCMPTPHIEELNTKGGFVRAF